MQDAVVACLTMRPHSALLTYAGGAQDMENARENIKAGYLPLVNDVSFEGVVKDYYL